MIEHINIIEALSDQISALLDLLAMSNDSVDHASVNTAAEMCLTMHDELMLEVKKIFEDWKVQQAEDEKEEVKEEGNTVRSN